MLKYIFKTTVKLYTLQTFLILWFTDLFLLLLGWVCVSFSLFCYVCAREVTFLLCVLFLHDVTCKFWITHTDYHFKQ